MKKALFVGRLTVEQVQNFLVDEMKYENLRMLEFDDMESDELKEYYTFMKDINEYDEHVELFFTTSCGEKIISMTDYYANIHSENGTSVFLSGPTTELEWECFLYSVFGKEYEEFWCESQSNCRKRLEKKHERELEEFDETVAYMIMRLKERN